MKFTCPHCDKEVLITDSMFLDKLSQDDDEELDDSYTVNPIFTQPVVYLSYELEAVVGPGPMCRSDITKELWDYIKKNGLQDKSNRRLINSDSKLYAIFGKQQVSMFEMTKLISMHCRANP